VSQHLWRYVKAWMATNAVVIVLVAVAWLLGWSFWVMLLIVACGAIVLGAQITAYVDSKRRGRDRFPPY
jgi:NADH:ubiquinone oxidoreductase subunit B-like Fe-S oxidoreductase